MLAIELPGCIGIQVESPEGKVNRELPYIGDGIEAAIETNIDNEDLTNRCKEPQLSLFRYYADYHRILSLVSDFEYQSALKWAQKCEGIPEVALKLLRHAASRADLLPDEAKKHLSHYDGIELFKFSGSQKNLLEYFLVMQMDQQRSHLSNLMVRVIPFLYEFLLEYSKANLPFPLQRLCQKKANRHFYLTRSALKSQLPGFLAYLEKNMDYQMRDCDLSFLLLYHYCSYVGEDKTNNPSLHKAIKEKLAKISDVRRLRNDAAHEIMNVTEDIFRQRLNMTSQEMVSIFFDMLRLIYGEEITPLRGTYKNINRWIAEAIKIPNL